MNMNDVKLYLKKFWQFVWHDDSLLSWIVNIVLAIVVVKFIIYPCLGLMMGSGFPVVAVMSGSMEHDSSFEDWWMMQEEIYSNYDIDRADFSEYRYKNGFNAGDVMVVYGRGEIRVGDVIVFQGSLIEPLIHRVVKINGDGTYQTKGDHNLGSRDDELSIKREDVFGKAVLRIPFVGWLKLGLVKFLGLFV